MSAQGIKSMKLYSQVERIHDELAAAGIGRAGPLRVAELAPHDQFHYHGAAAVDTAIESCGLTAACRVADVGAGIGGPARYLADKVGCRVTALELQPDLNELAMELTERCGLSDRVAHLCGDVLDGPLPPESFDAVVSWLAFYHIADHATLLRNVHMALKPSGRLYVEDLCALGPFTPEERELLTVKLYGLRLATVAEYRGELSGAGFEDIRLRDMTADWARFTRERLAAYRSERGRHVAVHGTGIVDALDGFYAVVDRLFQSGNLGGLRFVARKP